MLWFLSQRHAQGVPVVVAEALWSGEAETPTPETPVQLDCHTHTHTDKFTHSPHSLTHSHFLPHSSPTGHHVEIHEWSLWDSRGQTFNKKSHSWQEVTWK